MKFRRFAIAFLLVNGAIVQSCVPGNNKKPTLAAETSMVMLITPSPVSIEMPNPTQTMIPDYSETIKEFSGKWIGYSVLSLDPKLPSNRKPGMRLEIAVNRFVVDEQTCADPKYESNIISLKDFLSGGQLPESSFELNQEEFPFLQSGCMDLVSPSIALVNPRTLAGRVGNEILFFERDSSISMNGITVFTDFESDSNIRPLYEMHAQVPRLDRPNARNFNKIVRSIVDLELSNFKKNFDDWNIPPEMANRTSFMWIGYDVPLLTPEIISIRYQVDYYMAGAAHPNHNFKVLNYDLGKDKKILFTDLFKDPKAALVSLSKLSKVSLSKPDFPLFEEGFIPKPENYKNWNLTKDHLRLSFDPYDVAPYAAGAQEVLIPYTEIRDLIKQDAVASRFILGE
jgi:hypothetical protein